MFDKVRMHDLETLFSKYPKYHFK